MRDSNPTKALTDAGMLFLLVHVSPATHIGPYTSRLAEWESGLEDALVERLEQMKSTRLEREDAKNLEARIKSYAFLLYSAFIFSQPLNTLVPTLFDVCLLPEMSAALCKTPLDEELSQEIRDEAASKIPQFAEVQRQERINVLLDIFHRSEAYAGQQVNPEILSLASTIFRCGKCKQQMFYPTVLFHKCQFLELWLFKLEVIEEQEHQASPHLIPLVDSVSDADRKIVPQLYKLGFRSQTEVRLAKQIL